MTHPKRERQQARRRRRQAERCSTTYCEGFVTCRFPCGHNVCETCFLHGMCYDADTEPGYGFEHKCFLCRRVTCIDPDTILDTVEQTQEEVAIPVKGDAYMEAYLVNLTGARAILQRAKA